MKAIIAAATTLSLIVAPAFSEDAFAEEASSADVISLAEDYLAAYSTFDTAKFGPFYADNAVFSDPTSHGFAPGGGAFEYDGKAAIVKGLGDYAAQYKSFSVHYDLERRYESGGVVVFIAALTYESTSKDGKVYTGTNPVVTVVEVRDGKVVRHTDYYDYRENAVDLRAD